MKPQRELVIAGLGTIDMIEICYFYAVHRFIFYTDSTCIGWYIEHYMTRYILCGICLFLWADIEWQSLALRT